MSIVRLLNSTLGLLAICTCIACIWCNQKVALNIILIIGILPGMIAGWIYYNKNKHF